MRNQFIRLGIKVFAVLFLFSLLFSPNLAFAKAKEIRFWHAMGGWRVGLIERMAQDFNVQNPGVKVVPEFKGSYGDTFMKTIAAAKAGSPPHLAHVVVSSTREAIDSGLFVPIQDLADRFGIKIRWDDYFDPVLNCYRVGGKLYSIPWNSSSPILFWNKTIFDKAGVTLSKKPTWEEVTAAGRKIVKGGYAEYAITWPVVKFFFETWMAEMGQNLVDNENGRAGRPTKANFLSPEAERCFTWFKQLYDEHLWVNPGRKAWGASRKIFLSQKTAMQISSTGGVVATEKGATGKFELRTSYFPVPAGIERQGVQIGGGSIWTGKGHTDDETKAATQFALWMTHMSQTLRWHQCTGYYPMKKGASDILEREGWFEMHPDHKTALDQLLETKSNRATQGALVGAYRPLHDIIINVYEQIMKGKSVKSALAEADAKAKTAIAEYRSMVE